MFKRETSLVASFKENYENIGHKIDNAANPTLITIGAAIVMIGITLALFKESIPSTLSNALLIIVVSLFPATIMVAGIFEYKKFHQRINLGMLLKNKDFHKEFFLMWEKTKDGLGKGDNPEVMALFNKWQQGEEASVETVYKYVYLMSEQEEKMHQDKKTLDYMASLKTDIPAMVEKPQYAKWL